METGRNQEKPMESSVLEKIDIAIILPCHNEEAVITDVVKAFRASVPHARIYVIDNNSTDKTASVAEKAGALIIHEPMQGKGNALRRAFSEIDADVYLMADGDGTYDASRAPEMIGVLVRKNLDMIVGTRHTEAENAYRAGHRFGNLVFNILLRILFGRKFTDVFSGYRVFSRRFVKSFPSFSSGFEIETEISVHAIQMGVPTLEIDTDYYNRIEGTESKLNTYRDGMRIFFSMLKMMKHVRPMAMFFTIGVIFVLSSLVMGVPVILHFIETHTVPRIPTTIAASGAMILGAVSFVAGLILDNISYSYIVQKRLFYLSYPSNAQLLKSKSDDPR